MMLGLSYDASFRKPLIGKGCQLFFRSTKKVVQTLLRKSLILLGLYNFFQRVQLLQKKVVQRNPLPIKGLRRFVQLFGKFLQNILLLSKNLFYFLIFSSTHQK